MLVRFFFVIIISLAVILFPTGVSAATFYLSPTGSDTNAGSSESAPWKTFCRAFQNGATMNHGDTLILLDGQYYTNTTAFTTNTACNGSRNELFPRFSQRGADMSGVAEENKYAWIIAKNPGKAIVVGDGKYLPVYLSPFNKADYVHLEGLTMLNGGTDIFVGTEPASYAFFTVIKIQTDHNRLINISAYHPPRSSSFASPNQYQYDYNSTVVQIFESDYNLVQDSIFAGVGRKILYVYSSSPISGATTTYPLDPEAVLGAAFRYQSISEHNVFRRVFVAETDWEGRNFCGVEWPGGDAIQIYGGGIDNIVENAITMAYAPGSQISAHANGYETYMRGVKILGSVAVYAGRNFDGSPLSWNGEMDPLRRPGPTTCYGGNALGFTKYYNYRTGFDIHGQGYLYDNQYQNNLAYGNSGLGFSSWIEPKGQYQAGATAVRNNSIDKMTLYGNGDRLATSGYPIPRESTELGYDANFDVRQLPFTDSRTGSTLITLSNSKIEYQTPPSGMTANQYNGTGAEIFYQYQNGQLTANPLWSSTQMQNMRARVLNEFNAYSITQNFDFMKFLQPILLGNGARNEYTGNFSVIPAAKVTEFNASCCGPITILPTPSPSISQIPTPTPTSSVTYNVPGIIPATSYIASSGSFVIKSIASSSPSGDGGKQKIGDINPPVVLEYSLLSPSTTSYDFSIRSSAVASSSPRTVEIYINNAYVGVVTLPVTGGWDTFVDTSAAFKINLTSGNNRLKLVLTTGWHDFTSFTVGSTPATCSSRSRGDAQCDGKVDLIDFECWRSMYIKSTLPASCQSADFNNDTKSDLIDFSIWRNIYLAPPQ